MSLSLVDLGIQTVPVYIHKIDRPTYWKAADEVSQRATYAVSTIFKNSDYLYSLWHVESELDFYSIAASLNANRGSKSEQITFIWINNEELEALGLEPKPVEEGACLHSRKLHYNVLISPEQAYEFCYKLMNSQREASKCKQNKMISIIQYLTEKGCRVFNNVQEVCSCESV